MAGWRGIAEWATKFARQAPKYMAEKGSMAAKAFTREARMTLKADWNRASKFKKDFKVWKTTPEGRIAVQKHKTVRRITRMQTKLKRGQDFAKGRGAKMLKLGGTMGNMALGTGVALGAVSFMSIGLMQGMNDQAKDYNYDRYIQDYSYSKSVVGNSRVGRSIGMRSLDRYGSTLGLSSSLYATRHGR